MILLLKVQQQICDQSSIILIIVSLLLLKEIDDTEYGIQLCFLHNLILFKLIDGWPLVAHLQLILLYRLL
jgi:hypothetical protein